MSSDDRESRVIPQEPQLPMVDSDVPALKNAFLTQLRSKEFPKNLTKMLASQEDVDIAMSLRGDDALTLVDILDHAFEAPNVEFDLQKKIVRILRRVCGSQTILPRSCVLSENVAKDGDIALVSGGFADVWKGRYNGNRVCVRAFRVFAAENTLKIKRRLFQEIVIWRRLSHPNVLPTLGISPKLFPLCVITEWMTDGNIMDFTSKHPKVNRLRLLAEAASGLEYLHSMDIIHSDLKPTNVLIDRDFHSRLTDYGLITIMSDPNIVEPGNTASPSVGTVRYMAPELLNPSGFDLENSIPTKTSDIYAFGVVIYQVTSGQQPFPRAKDSVIIFNIVTGERPDRPPDPNEWVSDNVWKFISRCWSPSLDSRPDVKLVTNTLTDAANAVGTDHGTLYAAVDDQGGVPDPAAQSPQSFMASTAQPEPWEEDLTAFLLVYKTWDQSDQRKRAQEFADRLGKALDNADNLQEKRKQYLKDLRKLCGTTGILPSSFVFPPSSVTCDATPFASGGFSDVYDATFRECSVAVKILKVTNQTDQKKLYRLFVEEVVGWKWLRHENILPFVGVLLKPPLFSIISERMENGNIIDFIGAHPNFNRLPLLIGAVAGLNYLHEHGVVHGDLKGANILIDSECCARLADFGLAVVIDESITGSAAVSRAARGTIRYMAPELFDPDTFGFTSGFLKLLPSMRTDIYALGMTILEVITGSPPFSIYPHPYTVMYKVVNGSRPERPSSGFSDVLWGSLMASWAEEHAGAPQRRPLASTLLDLLKESVNHWEMLIASLTPETVGRERGKF